MVKNLEDDFLSMYEEYADYFCSKVKMYLNDGVDSHNVEFFKVALGVKKWRILHWILLWKCEADFYTYDNDKLEQIKQEKNRIMADLCEQEFGKDYTYL